MLEGSNRVVYSSEILESIECNEDIYLKDCPIRSRTTLDLTLTRKQVKITIRLIRCSFELAVRIQDVKFMSDVSFEGTQFNEGAYFLETEFQSKAKFNGAIFAKTADFSRSIFSSLDLSDTEFARIADFSECESDKALFTNTIFHDMVDFSRARLMEADFSDTVFDKEPETAGAKFLEVQWEQLHRTTGKINNAGKMTDKSKRVWIIHGRNSQLINSISAFLQALGLVPVVFSDVIDSTRRPTQFIGEVLDSAFEDVQAVVVLLAGDDEARLREEHIRDGDPPYEGELTPQPRPNVIFETGMAIGERGRKEKTILVQIGQIRPISDMLGMYILKLDNTPQKRHEFANRLRSLGCEIDLENPFWMNVGNFDSTE